MALGAAVLEHLWTVAWEDAGRPDLSAFFSYEYPTAPPFIAPGYLPGASDDGA